VLNGQNEHKVKGSKKSASIPLLYPDVRCEIPQIKKLVCWALIKESHAGAPGWLSR